MAKLTQQYLAYVDQIRTHNLELAAQIIGAAIVLASGLFWRRMHMAPQAAKG